jgi:hypothetical protein
MEEKEITPDQGLHIIQSMINTAKNKLADDGFLYIFWGWLVFVSALTNYILFRMDIEWGFIVWPVLMPIGGIVTWIYTAREKRNRVVKTYIDKYLGYLWTGFGIAMGVALFSLGVLGIKGSYFCLILLYGMVTFVSGALLDFRPLRIGALFSFAIGLGALFLPELEQFLCIAASVLCSYIIPGHLLRNEFKSQQNV